MSEETAAASPTKKAKGAPKAKKPAKATGAKKVSTHPPASQMVLSAVTTLKERHGSSLQAIKKNIADSYKVDITKQAIFIRKAVIKLVETGKLTQTKGTGASGSFKLPVKGKEAAAAAEPKAKATKPKKAKASPNKLCKSWLAWFRLKATLRTVQRALGRLSELTKAVTKYNSSK
jgi:histone H1/5